MKSGYQIRKIFFGTTTAYEVYRLTDVTKSDEDYNREVYGTYTSKSDAEVAVKLRNKYEVERYWQYD